jgi:hypothetical protein
MMFLDEYFDRADDIVRDVHNKAKGFYSHRLDLNLMLILQEHLMNVDDRELHNRRLDIDIIEYEVDSV